MSEKISVDLIIIGGGIAGLWTLNRAVQAGYNAILFEQHELGGGQSVHSQGIIHGGIKYALNGVLTPASNSIKEMPDIWRACLAGDGDIDLSKARILSNTHYMWSQKSLGGRLTTFFASKALRGRVNDVPSTERPAVFQNNAFKGSLYQLNELVLDVPSVIQQLAEPLADRIFKVASTDYRINTDDKENPCVEFLHKDLKIQTKTIVATCGEGLSALAGQLADLPPMQLRPLHMVMVKHSTQLPLYAHCFAGGTRPRVTVTTHFTQTGETVWYLGGELAEKGVNRDETSQIEAAKQTLKTLLPWVELQSPRWQGVRINRAEPAQTTLTLPDAAYTKQQGNLIVAWPTKLALAPDLANKVLTMLPKAEGGVLPKRLTQLEKPAVTKAIWENAQWS